MDIKKLSTKYNVRKVEAADIGKVYALCLENPMYYQYCPPMVTIKSIQDDLAALPKGKTYQDKYYVGFWEDNTLVAVLDLILKYPDEETCFIGFFMMNKGFQGQNTGSMIIDEVKRWIKGEGYTKVRLGFAKGNPQSEHFWTKNKFIRTGVTSKTELYDIIIMQTLLEQE